jgi:nucleoside-diphosphate-sugar epimerase
VVKRRVAVTGTSGFIGRHVVAHLAARGDDVIAIRRPFEPAALANALAGTCAVVHLAGVVSAISEREFTAGNVEATRAVADAARAAGVRLIHVSSVAAVGPAPRTAPRSEGDPPRPLTPYGRSKLEGERAVASIAGLRWITLRPAIVYGPADRALLPLFRLAARGVLPLIGHANAAYTFIHVRDVVRALAAAIEANADVEGDTFFVGHPAPVTTRGLLEGVRAAVGRPARIVPVPMALVRAAAIAGDVAGRMRGRPWALNGSRYADLAAEGFVYRLDRLRDRLGIVAEIGLQEGLADSARWYRQQGML